MVSKFFCIDVWTEAKLNIILLCNDIYLCFQAQQRKTVAYNKEGMCAINTEADDEVVTVGDMFVE